MQFDTILEGIKTNRKNHKSGYYNCIPFLGLERFEQFIPGIEHETYYLITASSGVGKSKLGRFLFIHNPLQYLEKNPESGVELSIIYFSLEESKKKVILSEISKFLHTKYNLSISTKELQSIGRYNTISDETLDKIKEAEEYVNNFLDKVQIVDTIRNPTGIYKYVRDYAMKIGRYYDKQGNPLTDKEHDDIALSKGDAYKKIHEYKKNNPKHFVIILTDHISLLEPERIEGQVLTQWQTMSRFSSKYCLHFRDKFGFTPVNIQQQSSDKERVDTDYRGKTIESKLEPSLDGLGDNKTTQRDANIVLGLFAPDRYNIEEHNGYDITFFRDRYRSLSVLKDRDGVANKKLPLFFNGAVDYFRELPRSDDRMKMMEVYKYTNNLNKK